MTELVPRPPPTGGSEADVDKESLVNMSERSSAQGSQPATKRPSISSFEQRRPSKNLGYVGPVIKNEDWGRAYEFSPVDPYETELLPEDVMIIPYGYQSQVTTDQLTARDDTKDVLKVMQVNTNPQINSEVHQTTHYQMTKPPRSVAEPQLVVRRGTAFKMSITFDRAIECETDEIALVFTFGPRPKYSERTYIRMTWDPVPDKTAAWQCDFEMEVNKYREPTPRLLVNVTAPVDGIVGRWAFAVETRDTSLPSHQYLRYVHNAPVYIIFNPFNKADEVGQSVPMQDEYVLNDRGRIFTGTQCQQDSVPWYFGQFDSFVLDCCMYLIECAKCCRLNWHVKGSALHVSKAIADFMVCKRGILKVRYGGNYKERTPPMGWTSSVSILKQWLETGETVRYGQCYVFSALFTTICRSLGIPCRCVTGYNVALPVDGHNASETNKRVHWNWTGTPQTHLDSANFWVFHVWNEIFIKRPNANYPHGNPDACSAVPEHYSGWQAIDINRLDKNGQAQTIGATQVVNIRQGLGFIPGVAAFSGTLNCRKQHYHQGHDRNWQLMNVDDTTVGACICTYLHHVTGNQPASPTSKHKHDLTANYKEVRANAADYSYQEIRVFKGLEFRWLKPEELSIDHIPAVFKLYLNTVNRMSMTCDNQEVQVLAALSFVRYNGEVEETFTHETKKPLKLAKNGGTDVPIKISRDKFLEALKRKDYYLLRADALVIIPDGPGAIYSDYIMLSKPTVTLEMENKVNFNERIHGRATFRNPFPVPLTKCEWMLEVPRVQDLQRSRVDDIPALSEGEFTFFMTPTLEEDIRTNVFLTFNSQELRGLLAESELFIGACADATDAEQFPEM